MGINKKTYCGKRKYKPRGLVCGKKYQCGYCFFIHQCKECIEKDINTTL